MTGKRRALAALVASIAGTSLFAGLSGSAGAGVVEPEGTTSCRASVFYIFGEEPLVANPDETPCVSDHAGAVDTLDLGPVQSRGVVSARTNEDPHPPFAVLSKSRAADVRIKPDAESPPFLRVQGTNARAGVRCTQKGNPKLKSRSRVAALRSNDEKLQLIRDEVELDLSPIAIVYLNRTIREEEEGSDLHRITQRAVDVDLGGDGDSDIVVSEAIANWEGSDNPCDEDTGGIAGLGF